MSHLVKYLLNCGNVFKSKMPVLCCIMRKSFPDACSFISGNFILVSVFEKSGSQAGMESEVLCENRKWHFIPATRVKIFLMTSVLSGVLPAYDSPWSISSLCFSLWNSYITPSVKIIHRPTARQQIHHRDMSYSSTSSYSSVDLKMGAGKSEPSMS